MQKLTGVALSVGVIMTSCIGASVSASAAQCMKVGGWGTGALEGFASFMAEAAMKNSAKARLATDNPKIGPVSQKCEQKGLLIECTATSKACK
jgi:hypothetical protein